MYHPQLQAAAPPPTFIEHYSALSYVLTDYGRRQSTTTIPVVPIQTLRFDDQQELIWSGNVAGHVTSYYSDQLTKYTSFSVGLDDPVLQLLTGDYGLLCLLKDELKLKNRRGIPKFSYSSSTFKDMVCMSKLPSQLILLGGLAQNIIEFDLERKRQLRTTELDSKEVGCFMIRQHPKFICCADFEGRITLRNTNNLAITHTFKTHTGQIADFDVHGNYLVTCGFPSSRPTPDRFLMVYDLRTYRLVTPIQTIFPPTLIRFIPAFTSKFCVASALGQFQLLDVAASPAENCTAFTHQVQLQPEASLTTMSVSSSGQALAFGDDMGLLHLFGTNTNVAFNQYSAPTEFPDPLEAVPAIDVDDLLIPLSIVPAYPYQDMYDKPISQSDGLTGTSSHGSVHKTPKIDEKILESITYRQDVGYAPNPYKSEGPISYIKGRVGVVGMSTGANETDTNEKSCKDLIEFANDFTTPKEGDRTIVSSRDQ
jgi:PAB-dependent poly(A)-specific ribonuclease subunit 2